MRLEWEEYIYDQRNFTVEKPEKLIPSHDNKLSEWQDCYGNVLPDNEDYRSENPTTFTVAHYLSKYFVSYVLDYYATGIKPYLDRNKVIKIVSNKALTNGNTWRTMEYDDNPDWSLDEKVSALAFFTMMNERKWVHRIPLLPNPFKNSSWMSWLRPDVIAYHLGCKFRLLQPLMYPIILLKVKLSMRKFRTHNKTSGIQLAFIMLMGWSCHVWIKENTDDIIRAFAIYYPDENHPTNKVWRILSN